MIRMCKKHGEVKHYSRKPSGWRCSKCSMEAVTKRRKLVKQTVVDERGGACERCGYNRYIGALQFHHLGDKSFGLSEGGCTMSLDKYREEADKCTLLCANCHAEIHSSVV